MAEHLLIISGASSGIGAALAEAAAADGARLATMSRRPGPGDHMAVDLAEPDQWPQVTAWIDALVAKAASDGFDRVSFVHNAGTLNPIGYASAVDLAAYTANVLVNGAAGQVLGAGFLRSMQAQGLAGSLVMVSSGAGKRPIPGWSSYCSAKAALDMWVQVAGAEQEAESRPVTVASIAPGVVDTDMQASIRSSSEADFPAVDNFRSMHRDGELRSPQEVAAIYWKFCQQEGQPQGLVGSVDSLNL